MKTQTQPVLTNINASDMDLSNSELVFLLQGPVDNRLAFPFHHRNLLEFLGFQVIKTPNKLIHHIQRIFYCFQECLPDQLYASIVDLLIVLKGRGVEISGRMFHGSKSKLRSDDREILETFYRNESMNETFLPVNRFCVLAKGFIGRSDLVVCGQKNEISKQNPLMLARQFIEYSQLEQAREFLETAIFEDPDNQQLHRELLDLYKSTRDLDAFQRIFSRLQKEKSSMRLLWEDFESDLAEINYDG